MTHCTQGIITCKRNTSLFISANTSSLQLHSHHLLAVVGDYSLYSNILQLSNTLMFSSIKCTFIYVEQLHSCPEALCKVNPLQYQMLQDMKDKKRKYRDQGENKTMGKREKLIHDMQQKQINTPRMKKHEQKCSVHHVKPVLSHGLSD